MGRDYCSHPQNMQSSQAEKLPYYLKEDQGSQTLKRGLVISVPRMLVMKHRL